MQQLPLGMRLADRAVFESFIAGPNGAAVAQLTQMAEGTARGVIWLCGAAGVGKTHLLQAACARLGDSAAYLPALQLAGLGPESLEGWHRSTLVCIDDVSAVLGSRPWEEALFRLYRETEERGASLIASAEAPPALSMFVLPDLATRFAAGLVFQLRSLPEPEQRAALRLRAHLRGLELPEETALYLQRRFRRDMPTLYGLLDALDEAALQAQRRLTLPFIREVLGRG